MCLRSIQATLSLVAIQNLPLTSVVKVSSTDGDGAYSGPDSSQVLRQCLLRQWLLSRQQGFILLCHLTQQFLSDRVSVSCGDPYLSVFMLSGCLVNIDWTHAGENMIISKLSLWILVSGRYQVWKSSLPCKFMVKRNYPGPLNFNIW